ncbi:ABC transporter ATP-binding protein [Myxosarcina sp. GI1]|uniref:ABC transporter ATP-binding protein n=1 Tax=Myxosarcina sp. GI1 TaxID=1541065 RepID=UPI00055FAA86|nr:ATP-binding cassette domain-containing protein [Myxosarcina sp. GI1]
MAKVVFENVDKSYPRRERDGAIEQLDGKEQKVRPAIAIANTIPTSTKAKSRKSDRVGVLHDINLIVEDGEFMVLVGPSGCGKSTLLRMLSGLETITAGKIWIGDRLVNNLPPKARDIAMVFQNYALYPHLNIYDNIAFGLRRGNILSENGKLSNSNKLDDFLVGITRSLPRKLRYLSAKEKSVRSRVRQVASLLQIETLLNRLPKELSGGQKQRVALGRAIARNPQVFLMDEPLSNLDAKLRTETRAQIVKLQRQLGTTTIYVTHDQTEAMTMGDRIAVMNDGRIQQIAPPLEIYQQPANRFVAEFIGSPPMNFLPVELVAPLTLAHPQFKLTLPEFWAKPIQDSNARFFTLGIRPQHLQLGDKDESNISVTVDLVEALGSETYVSAHLNEDIEATINVTLTPDKRVAMGDRLWLSIQIDKIHLFRVDGGKSLLC